MRVIVYGAGAVGGVIGANLARHGHDVVLIARGPHHDAIRARGLCLETPDEAVTLPVVVVDHPSRVGFREGDLVLLAMKTQDTAAAVAALRAVAPDGLPVVCAQNGVENERIARRVFEHVYGMCVMLPAAHLEPGVVQAASVPVSGLLDVGRASGGVDETCTELARMLSGSGFDSNPVADVMRWKYTKLLMNLGNAAQAACAPGPETAELVRRARREGVACYRAAGIDFASQEEDAARRGDRLQPRPIGGAERPGGSSWQSLQRGTGTIEADYLNGEICLLGRLHGVPTPVNALLQAVAGRLAREGAPPARLDGADLLAQLP
jgi:2-dehydropantoate 2-reductase